ncbi:DNA cytosine methyltransferase [Pseudomonas frederiksbergensis]|uniref:DNA cytosine methyltransferase n=1 Tax=Pseudomonas frederiksbergensis TaxID=104087 RepID=UPI003D262829
MYTDTDVKNPDTRKDSKASTQPITTMRGHTGLPKIISLFCGAGGLDWGFHQEGFQIPVAIDISAAAISTHKKNFPKTHSIAADLIQLQPEGVFELVTKRVKSKSRIGLIGGPPCQGFSRANTNSKVEDPRNQLPQLYLDIVKRLQADYIVEFVVFENVLGIRDKKHAPTYEALIKGLESLGFCITEKELCALDFGVPQNRRRIVLSALRAGQGYGEVRPETSTGLRTVQEAIGTLAEPTFFDRKLRPEDIPVHPNHWTMNPKSPRFSDPDGKHPKGRSFKRLSWSDASPTIAFGHREIHIHPSGTRRLSIYEAMILQSFPSSFVLEGNLSQQVEQVSNAVPPLLGKSIAAAVKNSMKIKKTKEK